MGHPQWLLEAFAKRGVSVERGLEAAEIERAERAHGVVFPPDLAGFLAEGLPVGDGFPDWRRGGASVAKSLSWPLEGLLFDVKQQQFWVRSWGRRPNRFEKAKAVVEKEFAKVPRLVPVYSHRYLPASPCEPGNPVFSVYQADVIVYGNDLADWLAAEFAPELRRPPAAALRRIEFWTDLTERTRPGEM